MAEGQSAVGEVRVKPDRLHAFTMAICRADGSSDEEARLVADHLVLANLFGHDSHGVGMIPHYIQNTTTGACVRNHHAKIVARQWRRDRDRRRRGLRPGRRQGGHGYRHRAGQEARRLRRRPHQRPPYRPHRPLGRAVRARRHGEHALGERARPQVAGGAVRRRRAALHHQPLLHGRAAQGQGADRARLRHQPGGDGQGARRQQQEGADGGRPADRRGRPAHHRSRRAVQPALRRHPAVRPAQGRRARRDLRPAGRRADRRAHAQPAHHQEGRHRHHQQHAVDHHRSGLDGRHRVLRGRGRDLHHLGEVGQAAARRGRGAGAGRARARAPRRPREERRADRRHDLAAASGRRAQGAAERHRHPAAWPAPDGDRQQETDHGQDEALLLARRRPTPARCG